MVSVTIEESKLAALLVTVIICVTLAAVFGFGMAPHIAVAMV